MVEIYHFDQSAPETVKVPQMAESITEGTLKQWSKQVGDTVNQDDEVATIETDKVRRDAVDSLNGAHAYIEID